MMEPSFCSANCSVQYLSQLYVCTAQGCISPPIRCKDCFWKQHASVDQLGKKKTHEHQKFDQSPYYRNFCSLIKVYEIILHKLNKAFGKVNHNAQYFAAQIFNTCDFITKIFHSQHALGQFYILRQLYYQRQAKFANSPSADLLMTLALFTQKTFISTRSLLLQSTQQQQLLGYYFNFISNNGPQAFQKFIGNQQLLFSAYCDQIREKNQPFLIENYISRRNKQQNKDPLYYSPTFLNFLQSKYQQRPQQKQLFIPSQYTNYVWQNLQAISLNKQIQQYLNTWVKQYTQFAQYMKSQNLQPTLLGFRMWKQHGRNHHQQLTAEQKIQNKYFLDNFIFSFIDVLINNQYSVTPSSATTWNQYIKYLRDYVALTKLKQEQFVDITKYAPYYEFRHKNQDFVAHVQKSQDISFNRQLCVEYLNNAYKQGGKVSLKNYKKLLATKQQQNIQKQTKLINTSQSLQKQLQQLQGDKFYLILYNDYLRQCLKDNTTPNKQGFLQFKKSVLQGVDEQGIKLQNDRMLLQQKQALQQTVMQQKKEQKQSDAKVSYEIDKAEEHLANVQGEESSNQGEPTDPDCPCCGGKPEECDKPECQMMGYCVACSL